MRFMTSHSPLDNAAAIPDAVSTLRYGRTTGERLLGGSLERVLHISSKRGEMLKRNGFEFRAEKNEPILKNRYFSVFLPLVENPGDRFPREPGHVCNVLMDKFNC